MSEKEWRAKAAANPGMVVYPQYNPSYHDGWKWVPRTQSQPWMPSRRFAAVEGIRAQYGSIARALDAI
jgi:hypothetical protein